MEKLLLQKAKVLEDLNQQLAVKFENRTLLSAKIEALENRLFRVEEELLQLSQQILDCETCAKSDLGLIVP